MDQMMSSTKLPRDFPKAHQLPKTLFCMVGFQLMKHSESFFLSLSLFCFSPLSLPPVELARRPLPARRSPRRRTAPALLLTLRSRLPARRRVAGGEERRGAPGRSLVDLAHGATARAGVAVAHPLPPPPSLPHQSRPRRRPTAVTLVRPCRGAPPLLEPLARRRAAPLLLPSESR
jgi:hypothetical protein